MGKLKVIYSKDNRSKRRYFKNLLAHEKTYGGSWEIERKIYRQTKRNSKKKDK